MVEPCAKKEGKGQLTVAKQLKLLFQHVKQFNDSFTCRNTLNKRFNGFYLLKHIKTEDITSFYTVWDFFSKSQSFFKLYFMELIRLAQDEVN